PTGTDGTHVRSHGHGRERCHARSARAWSRSRVVSPLPARGTTDSYTLSLHDALPISPPLSSSSSGWTPLKLLTLKVSFPPSPLIDRKSTRLNSSHVSISYAVFCLKKTISKSAPRLPECGESISQPMPRRMA